MNTHTSLRTLTAALMVSASLIVISDAASAKTADAEWNPAVTERLVKLPQTHLKKSLDRDFARSGLAGALANAEEEIKYKVETLGDLRTAADQATGDLQIELRHQLLAEKRAYLNLVKGRQDLRRQALEKRKKVYGRILAKVLRAKGGNTEERVELVRQQEAAQARFKKSADAVDMKVFASFDAPQSKYAGEYAKNLSAANALLQAISKHPMQRQATDADPVDKADYLRRLVADAEGELSLVQQETEIVGYMAKLVALDAAAFSEELANDGDDTTEQADAVSPVTSALSFFIQ